MSQKTPSSSPIRISQSLFERLSEEYPRPEAEERGQSLQKQAADRAIELFLALTHPTRSLLIGGSLTPNQLAEAAEATLRGEGVLLPKDWSPPPRRILTTPAGQPRSWEGDTPSSEGSGESNSKLKRA